MSIMTTDAAISKVMRAVDEKLNIQQIVAKPSIILPYSNSFTRLTTKGCFSVIRFYTYVHARKCFNSPT